MKSTKLLSAAAIIFAAVVGGVAILSSDKDDPVSASLPDEELEQRAPHERDSEDAYLKKVSSQDVLGYKSALGFLPDSLNGTHIGEVLVVDEDGHLRLSGDIQRVFDFFLSTVNEEPLETILARIDEYLNHYLEEPAVGEARAILEQYVAMKEALFEYQQNNSDRIQSLVENGLDASSGADYLSLLEQQMNDRNALRAEHLSPEVRDAFYGEEEEYDHYTLSRLKINSDRSLSAEEKTERLESLDNTLPAHVAESRRRTQATDILTEKTQALRDQGASQEEIRALRTEMFGAEAADRFEELDQERAEWSSRLNSYLSERQVILDNSGLSDDDRIAQVDELRAASFDSREQIRVRYLETQN